MVKKARERLKGRADTDDSRESASNMGARRDLDGGVGLGGLEYDITRRNNPANGKERSEARKLPAIKIYEAAVYMQLLA